MSASSAFTFSLFVAYLLLTAKSHPHSIQSSYITLYFLPRDATLARYTVGLYAMALCLSACHKSVFY